MPNPNLAHDRAVIGSSGERRENHQEFAFDRGSVRHTDDFGRLHVANSNISKANICTYYGYEIPDHEALGLDPQTPYKIYRDPAELEKAAPTFNRLQILNKHVAVSADDPQSAYVVGTTGDNATFNAPYLQNSSTYWDSSAIAGINTGEQRELSASYKWKPDMTPGEVNGENYDGRMTNIVGNHVALVPVGRAGSDVLVNDAKPQPPMRNRNMKLSNRSAARAVLGAHLLPSLAQDSAVDDIKTVMGRVNDETTTADLAADAAKSFPDAKIDVQALTSALDFAMDTGHKAESDDEETEQEKKDNESEAMRIKEREKREKDDDEDDEYDEDGNKVKSKKKDDDKPAMDAATIRDQAKREAMADFNALRKAESDVRPLVGDLAEDSAEATYRVALDQLGIDHQGVDPSAYPHLVRMHRQYAEKAETDRAAGVTMDSAHANDFKSRFPEANQPMRIS